MYSFIALVLVVCSIVNFIDGDTSSGYNILTISLIFSLMSQIYELRKEIRDQKEETEKEMNKKVADAVLVSSVLNALVTDKVKSSNKDPVDSVVEKE